LKDPQRPVYRIAAPIKNLAQRFAYMGLVVTAFALMLLGKADTVMVERVRAHVTDAVAPILDVMSRPVATANEVIDQVRELVDLRAENQRLRQEKARLLRWQTVARRMEAENGTLRAMLNFNAVPPASFVSARVIADNSGAFSQSLVLNAGAREGVRKGSVAITGDGLVGRIAATGNRSARLLLITDLNSHIPVLLESSGIRAILAGDNTDRPRLIRLPQRAAVTPGERIVTSGHGGAFPPRLPVGVVASVSESGIRVQPFVERNHIEYVRVVDFGLSGILALPQSTRPVAKPSAGQPTPDP
jgi:rod shape-determining protein MreC